VCEPIRISVVLALFFLALNFAGLVANAGFRGAVRRMTTWPRIPSKAERSRWPLWPGELLSQIGAQLSVLLLSLGLPAALLCGVVQAL
jgi:hypothetical protein